MVVSLTTIKGDRSTTILSEHGALKVCRYAEHLHRRKEIYEAMHPEAKAGQVRAAGMNKALGRNVDEIISPTFTSDTASQ